MSRKSEQEIEAFLQDYVFFDVEASGLHMRSYPIEFGWSGMDLVPHSMILRPAASWSMDDWNFDSEKIHGIPRGTTEVSGVDLDDAMDRIRDEVAGRILVSDAPSYEQMWLNRFFLEVRKPCEVRIVNHTTLMGAVATFAGLTPEDVLDLDGETDALYPHPHRAGPDAVGMAAEIRILYDVGFRDRVRAANASRGAA